MTPEEKLERSRVRNRDHSRKSRQRKKALVEGMKKQVKKGWEKPGEYAIFVFCFGGGGRHIYRPTAAVSTKNCDMIKAIRGAQEANVQQDK